MRSLWHSRRFTTDGLMRPCSLLVFGLLLRLGYAAAAHPGTPHRLALAGASGPHRRLSQVEPDAGACAALANWSTPVAQWMLHPDPGFKLAGRTWGWQFHSKDIGSCGGPSVLGLDHQPVGMLPYRDAHGKAAAFAWVFSAEHDQRITLVECHGTAAPITLLAVREGCGLQGKVVLPTVETSGCGWQPATFTARAGMQYTIFSQAPAPSSGAAADGVCYRPVLYLSTSLNTSKLPARTASPAPAPSSLACPQSLAPIPQDAIQPVAPDMPMRGTLAGACGPRSTNPVHQPTCATVDEGSVAFAWVSQPSFSQRLNLTICHGPDVPSGSTSVITIRAGCDATSPVVGCFGYLSGCSYEYGGVDFWAQAGITYTIWMQPEAPELGTDNVPICVTPQLYVSSYGAVPPSPPSPPRPPPFPLPSPRPSPSPLPGAGIVGSAALDPATAPSPAASSLASSDTHAGMYAGIAVGAAAGAALLCALAALLFTRSRRALLNGSSSDRPPSSKAGGSGVGGQSVFPSSMKQSDSMAWSPSEELLSSTSAVVGEDAAAHASSWPTSFADAARSTMGLHNKPVFGLLQGDVFLKATADNYRWTDYLPDSSTVFVEAGVNDTQLDSWASSMPAGSAARLSKEELASQVHLLRDGLLGKGATAYVFACRWQQRFGEHALLAAKVLMDGYHAEPYVLDAFAYEAGVLASVRHPNIVRLYGYCLEPPCVCLILELLPGSLKSILYNTPSAFHTLTRPTTAASQAQGASQSKLPAAPHLPRLTPASGPCGPLAVPALPTTHFGSTCLTSPGPLSSGDFTIVYPAHDVPDTLGSQACMGEAGVGQQAGHGRDGGRVVASSWHSQYGPLTMREVLRISRDVAAGLAHLHDQPVVLAPSNATPVRPRQGMVIIQEQAVELGTVQADGNSAGDGPLKCTARVVHRDLKPANILIGQHGVAKISDFGLARQTYSTTLHTGSVGAGTLPYMAPELLLLGRMAGRQADADKATSRVDIYSMAMIMWELVSRQQPWYGRSESEILAMVTMGLRPHMADMLQHAFVPGMEALAGQQPLADTSTASGAAGQAGATAQSTAGKGPEANAINSNALGPCSSDNDSHKQPDDAEQLDLSQVPASFSVVPQFTAIIMQCWDQQPLQRPTAGQVYKQLQALCSRHASEGCVLAQTGKPK